MGPPIHSVIFCEAVGCSIEPVGAMDGEQVNWIRPPQPGRQLP